MRSIFISSTFRDMQAERDILHLQVFPELRKRLAAYGEDVQELDLRWGVDTSRMTEEKSGEFVVESCIDSIDRCKPYMIVLLGNRYGWIPERHTIDATADDRIQQWYETGSSITQLEIQYGALRADVAPDRCIFCFRNENFPDLVPEGIRNIYAPESDLHKEKLQQLKQRIRSRQGARILDYTANWDVAVQGPGGLEAFAAELTEAVWQILSRDLKAKEGTVSEEERIFQQARLTARQYLSSYVSRKMDRETGPYALVGRSAFWFSGEPGSGKSAMMAKIADNGTRIGVKVFLYYGGNGGCHSANTLARTLIWWFNQMDAGEKPLPLNSYLDKNISTLDTLLRRDRAYDYAILVDGVDQMDDDARDLLCWMRRVMIPEDQPLQFPNWHGLAVSSTDDYRQHWETDITDAFSVKKLEPLNHVELDSIAQSQSARRGKKLDAEVMRRIRAKEAAHNPYYLSLLLQKLFMMDRKDFEQAESMAPGMAGLSLFMCRELEVLPETAEALTISLLQETCQKLGSRMCEYCPAENNVADPIVVLALLAASREGLTLAEINRALGLMNLTFPTLFLERLFVYLYDSFSESETGVWDFKHRLLREGLLAHIGQQRARAFCTIILALRWEQNANPDELLYYAWKSGDIKMALTMLKGHRIRMLHAPSLIRMLQTEDGAAYLTAFLQQLDSDRCCHILLELVQHHEQLACKEVARNTILAAAQPRAESSKAHHFYYHLLRQWLLFWNYETRGFEESWSNMMAALPKEGDPANMSRSLLFSLCLEILGDRRYRQLWPQVLQYLETYRPKSYQQDAANAALQWARLLNAYQSSVDANNRQQETRVLETAKDYLRNLQLGYVVVDSWRALLAELFLEKEAFQEVYDLTGSRLGYLERQFHLRSGPLVAMRLIRSFTCFTGAIKAEAAVKSFRLILPICRRAMRECPSTYLQYLTCRVLIRMRNIQKQAGDTLASHKTLELLIPELDRFTEQIGADNLSVEVLQEFLDQRYHRVNLRRTTCYLADKDTRQISMDVMLQVAQGNYANVPKAETWIKPWKFLQEQEADFTYMEELYPPLEKRCKNYSVYIDMVYARLEQARFYDACHLENKLIAVCNKLLSMASFMADTRRNNLIWLSLAVRLELAELLFRYYYSKSAADLAAKAFEMMQNLDGKWIQDTDRVDEFNRRSVRCYLVMARAKMYEKNEDSLKSAFAFTYNAINKLSGKDDIPAMSKSCDDLRCETWLLMGQIIQKLQQDPSDILARADKYWPESEVDKALLPGEHSQLVRLLYYTRGLSLRSRTQEDGKLMEKATRYLCRIAMEQVQDQDASLWEELFDELMTACRFYWNRTEKLTTPDCLHQCMTRALYRKQQRGDLTQEEQILFASYALLWQDPRFSTGEELPEEDYLTKALACTVALNRKRGRGCLRGRLAMIKMLHGDYAGAQNVAMDITGLSSLEEIKLISLLGVITGGLSTGKPPREPRLPMGRDWLNSPYARPEPFIARYLEPICALLDSRCEGPSGAEAALHGLMLLKPMEEAFEKKLKQTEVPTWAREMCLRLIRFAEQTPGCVDSAQYIDALKVGQEGARVIYYRNKEDADLDACIRITIALMLAYHNRQDHRRAALIGQAALRQSSQLRKQSTVQSRKEDLALYRCLRSWQEEHGTTAKDALWLMGEGGQILSDLFDMEKDLRWIRMLLEETANYRRILPKCQEEHSNWIQEKTAESYESDRQGCMRVLELVQEGSWQQQYLRAASAQLDILGESRQDVLEDILADLWQIQPQSGEIRDQRLDLVDRLTDQLRNMPDDTHYIILRAVQAGAQPGAVDEFLTTYRAAMPGQGL